MPDLTQAERERIAGAMGWRRISWCDRQVWVRETDPNAREWEMVDDPPALTTDELFGLLDRLYPNGWSLTMYLDGNGIVLAAVELALAVDDTGSRTVMAAERALLHHSENCHPCCDMVSALKASVQEARATLAALEKEAKDGA